MRAKPIVYKLLLIILAYLPLRAVAYTAANKYYGASLGTVLRIFPEGLLGVAFVLAIIVGWRQYRKIPRIILLALALLAWSAGSAGLRHLTLSQSVTGIIFDFEGLIALLVLWLTPASEVASKRMLSWLQAGLWLLAAAGVYELLAGSVIAQWSGLVPLVNYVGRIQQLRSLVATPNIFASLMVLLAGLILLGKSKYQSLTLAVTGALIGLTYSRSAWVATIVLSLGVAAWQLWRRRLPTALLLLVFLAVAALANAQRYHESLSVVITHGVASTQHVSSPTQAVHDVVSRPAEEVVAGGGAGTAGPASVKTTQAKVAESWYLQLLQEIGVGGLLLYLLLMAETIWCLIKARQAVLTLLTIALMTNAIFLHTWAENHYLNLAFWLVIGLALFTDTKQKSTK